MSNLHDESFRAQLHAATAFLARIAQDRALLVTVPDDERLAFLHEVAQVFHPDARARRAMVKATSRERKASAAARDDTLLNDTGIRALRRRPIATTPNVYLSPAFEGETPTSVAPNDERGHERDSAHAVRHDVAHPEAMVGQHCYICKEKFTAIHHFYDQMCGSCGDFNFAKRTELADLHGRTALLTGGRVKIGYQAGLKLLRAGARLLVTTRFPRDAATRYAAEPDFVEWGDRLQLFGLDLRHTPSVEAFCARLLQSEPSLDFIINNACQTVRRPPAFYAHMMEAEEAHIGALPSPARRLLAAPIAATNDLLVDATDESSNAAQPMRTVKPVSAALLSQLALLPDDVHKSEQLFPRGLLDLDRQQVDLRERNSWRLLLDEVPSVELLEVQLVNAIAPFIINARLKPLLLRTPSHDKHIVNVSAMEGQFYRNNKTTRHPHTNMAKAALNMMTRTSAADYEQHGIHMNSVDTGWVTDEDAAELAARKAANHRFHPPLDIVDGAARITDPIMHGINSGEHVWGQFLKDYRVTDW